MSVKFTVFFEGHGFGASESWYVNSNDPAIVVGAINPYLSLRSQMLFSDCEIQGVRIGNSTMTDVESDGKDALRQSQPYLPGTHPYGPAGDKLVIPQTGKFTPVDETRQEAFANIAVNERIGFNTGKFTTRYVVWPPAADINRDLSGGNLAKESAWFGLLGKLQNLITATGSPPVAGGPLWIKARTPSTISNTYNIRKWVLQGPAPANVGFIALNSQTGTFAIGDLVHIRGTKRKPAVTNTGATKLVSLNGSYYIDDILLDTPSTGLSTVFLAGTNGVDTASIKLLGNFQLVRFQLFAATSARAVRIRTHKRGKPSLVPRGRRLSRRSVDP
jgi:hypothetical protein